MSEEAYPISVEELAATLQDLSHHSSDRKIREVLEESSWSLPFVHADDWNGGTEYFLLNLAVPTALFASVRESKEEVENEILKMVGDIDVAYANHTISRGTCSHQNWEHCLLKENYQHRLLVKSGRKVISNSS